MNPRDNHHNCHQSENKSNGKYVTITRFFRYQYLRKQYKETIIRSIKFFQQMNIFTLIEAPLDILEIKDENGIKGLEKLHETIMILCKKANLLFYARRRASPNVSTSRKAEVLDEGVGWF